MLAPMRPSPAMTRSIVSVPPSLPGCAARVRRSCSREGLAEAASSSASPASTSSPEVDAEGRQAVAAEGREVAQGLGSMSMPNVSLRPGMGTSAGAATGELDEAADRRAALVELAGRVQEARPVAERRGPPVPSRSRACSARSSSRARLAWGRCRRRSGGSRRSGTRPRCCAQRRHQVAPVARRPSPPGLRVRAQRAAAGGRLHRGRRPSWAKTLEDARRVVLGLGDVGLVERVDARGRRRRPRWRTPSGRTRRRPRRRRRGGCR